MVTESSLTLTRGTTTGVNSLPDIGAPSEKSERSIDDVLDLRQDTIFERPRDRDRHRARADAGDRATTDPRSRSLVKRRRNLGAPSPGLDALLDDDSAARGEHRIDQVVDRERTELRGNDDVTGDLVLHHQPLRSL